MLFAATKHSEMIGPERLGVPTCRVDEIPQMLKDGIVAKFDARELGNADIYEWSINEWRRRYGSRIVNRHVLRPVFEQRLRELADKLVGNERLGFDAFKDTVDSSDMVHSEPMRF